jgi:hypothetical protein
MIWLFKSDESFDSLLRNKRKVDEYFIFDVNDINFDITKYDISLYFGTSKYFLLDESNGNVYFLQFKGSGNPNRFKLLEGSPYCNMIKSFYDIERRDKKLNELLRV